MSQPDRNSCTSCRPGSGSIGRMRFSLAGLGLLIVLATAPATTTAQDIPANDRDATQQYFEGLRERRLFSLAESVCLQQLARETYDVNERTQYAVELSRTLAEHARYVLDPLEQSDLLQRARDVVQQAVDEQREHPQLILLNAQQHFVTCQEIELLRWRHQLAPHDAASAERAVKLAGEVTEPLETLDRAMTDELSRPFRDPLGQKLTPWQLRGLQKAVRFRLGSVHLDRARLLPRGSQDRAEALLAATRWLEPLAGTQAQETIVWQSQLALIETLRLRGDLPLATRLAQALADDKPPAAYFDEATAELVEIQLEQQDFTGAADRLREHQQSQRQRLSGRLSYLNAVAIHEMWKLVKGRDEALAAELYAEVVASVQSAASTANGYWSQRAQRLLTDAQFIDEFGPTLGPRIGDAQRLFAAGQRDAAITIYTEAFELARRSATPEIAASVGYSLGSMLIQAGRFADAAQVMNQTVQAAPNGPRAADADLLAAWSLGRVYGQQPNSASRETYATALTNHAARFPNSPTAGEATWMLAQLEEQRLQSAAALKLYAQVPDGHPRADSARTAVARCGEAVLKRLDELGQPRDQWEAALNNLLARYTEPLLMSEQPLNPSQADLLLRTARLLLTQPTPDFARADRILESLLSLSRQTTSVTDDGSVNSSATAIPDDIVQAGIALRILSLAGRGERDTALHLLENASSQGSIDVEALLRNLTQAAEGLDGPARAAVGELQIRAIELANIQPDELNPDERREYLLAASGAYETAGITGSAIHMLTQASLLNPKDADLLRRLARLSKSTGEAKHLELARETWLKVEALEKPGSAAWQAARLESIGCLIDLRQTDEASRLLRVTQLLYPPATEQLARDFAEIAQRLK